VFSIDVAATKARNMVYFNSSGRTAADLNGVPMGIAVTKPDNQFWRAGRFIRRESMDRARGHSSTCI